MPHAVRLGPFPKYWNLFKNIGTFPKILAPFPKYWHLFQNNGTFSKILGTFPKYWDLLKPEINLEKLTVIPGSACICWRTTDQCTMVNWLSWPISVVWRQEAMGTGECSWNFSSVYCGLNGIVAAIHMFSFYFQYNRMKLGQQYLCFFNVLFCFTQFTLLYTIL